MLRLLLIVLCLLSSTACGPDEGGFGFLELEPAHCRIPLARQLPVGDPDAHEYWLPGPMATLSTVDWPECPPLDESTADDDPPRITYPADDGTVADGRWPVVVFGHANSVSVCNPTDRYRSLHEQWASWGWVVYSIDASEQNCTDYSVEQMKVRVDKFDLAVEDLAARNADPRSPFHGKLDLDRLVSAGHSRGGAAAITLSSRDEKWKGAINLMGGNPSRFGLGDRFTTRPVINLVGGLDKDLDFPHVDLSEGLMLGRYSYHTIRRGNHTYTADGLPIRFNDVPEEILPRLAQLELVKFLTTTYLAVHFGIYNGGEFEVREDAERLLYSHFGDELARGLLRGSGFVSRWDKGPEHPAIWIDRFDSRARYNRDVVASMLTDDEDDEPDLDPDDLDPDDDDDDAALFGTWNDPDLNDLGLPNECDGLTCTEAWTYAPDETDETRNGQRILSSLRLVSNGTGRWSTVVEQDIPSKWRFQARVRENVEIDARFDIVLEGPGGEQRVAGVDVMSTGGLSDRFEQVDFEVELDRVDRITFEVHEGELFVDDLRIAAP